MKALVLKEYMKFSYEDVPDPEVGDDDVLIRVKACSICGSDVHGMDGSTGRRIPPIIMGHEASGVIEKKGKNVEGFNVGDHVTFDSTVYCGKCYFCKMGKINLCDNRRVLGVSCEEYHRDGAFAEYVSVPYRILYKIPDDVSFERAAMVEPLSIALHAVNRTPISLGDIAVVIGSGMIGLLIIQVLVTAGCSKVIAVDIDQNKLDMARNFGAFTGLKADTVNVEKEVFELTDGRGADVAFEVVGINSTVNTAVNCVRKGGFVTLVGNLSPEVKLPLQKVVTREISINGSCASSGEYDRCLDMISSGKVNVDAFISAVAPLSEGALWFEKLYKAEPGLMKVILKP
ncbi:MAG TPA: galactitol-1-phosphate 5-dehydrogenase [Clostridiaceae bacterium]|nr:galactitol-1-phosphate 5-dehydrogenase [Clostridiaceae bacterium]